MRIIDLLNKIANGEEAPEKIKYDGSIYKFDNLQDDYMPNDNYEGLLDELCTFSALNDEVEIIEEDKKIEKIIPTSLKDIDNLDEKIEIAHIDTISAIDKINEIIDYINKGE